MNLDCSRNVPILALTSILLISSVAAFLAFYSPPPISSPFHPFSLSIDSHYVSSQPSLNSSASQYREIIPIPANNNDTLSLKNPPFLLTSSNYNSSEFTYLTSKPLDQLIRVQKRRYTNLEKLEASLRRARITIHKGVSENHNTSELWERQFAEDEPFGPVYRNADIFRRSYREMERKLAIFVYPQGEEPLVHNGPCKEIYAVEGRFIQELQGKNSFLTTDPDNAHLFFLPFSVSMLVTYLYTQQSKDMKPLTHFIKDYVNLVAGFYPFWNRSEGADHFILSCHDWAPHLSKAHPHLAKNAIRVLCNSNLSEGYVPTKDVSLPEINLIGGRIPARLGGRPGNERKYLAFFAGREHGPVRPILFKYWERIDDDVRVFKWLPAEFSYHEFMKNSRFCICPGGYEVNSPRIVEAIYNDCVPVIIADNFILPFSDVLQWETFSLHLPEREIPNLKRILQDIPQERYEQMQARVKEVRRHFLLNQPPKRYDAFHMILHSLWLRRLNVRIL